MQAIVMEFRPSAAHFRSQLIQALGKASTAARNFSIHEAKDDAQRERYVALADVLEAQVRSLRAEV